MENKIINEQPIRKIKIGDCDVTILGTAHISKVSVDVVTKIIQDDKPDTVCVELCETRYNSIKDPNQWQKMDIFKVFKERRMYLLLSSLILSSFQKKMGKGEIKPGDEFRAAIIEGEKIKAKVIPIDRNVQTTLKRAWSNVSLFSRMYLSSALIASLLVKEDISQEKIEEMKNEDVLKDLFSQLPARYNQIKNVIIDERDIYLAENIRRAAKNSKKLFAAVGAGHLEGMMNHIQNENDISKLDEIPQKTFFQKSQWMIFPIILIAIAAATFHTSGAEAGKDLIFKWILFKSTLAAIGAIIALAHPFSIILAALIAPIGNFNFFLKPGWAAALCESWLRKPLVEDFEKIADDSEHFTGYWKNRVIRIFLVFTLPQVGSSIGTFLVTWQGLKGLF